MRAATAQGAPRPLPIGVTLTRTALVLGGGGLLLGILLVTAVALGSTPIGIGDTAAILAHRLLGLPLPRRGRPAPRRSSCRSACRGS